MRLFFLLFVLFFVDPEVILSANKETLIGGKPVKKGDYPEVVRIKSCREKGMCASCTATVIGPRALLTAGHCLYSKEKKISFQFEQNIYNAQCENHPLYPHTEDMDMALCKIDKKVEVKYAHIDKKPVVVGEKVVLIGYGCLRDETPRGGNDGILRVGESKVIQLPQADPVNNWYYTRSNTALCFGDSGGPSFKRIKKPKSEVHMVAGINSRGNIKDLSLLTAIYLDKGIKFLEDYSEQNKLVICGITNSSMCNVKSEKPKDDNECAHENKKVDYYIRKLDKWENKLNECINEVF